MMKNIAVLLRPQQWLKNGFIFIPLFFDHKLMDWYCLCSAILAFFAYSFAASAIYCLNDLIDVDADRKHPKKCKRPIAAGVISKAQALLLVALCLGVAFAIASMLEGNAQWKVIGILGVYIVMNIAYCLKLKQMAIVDVFIIAVGFVLRIFVGGFATGVVLSQWIVLMTFLLALFLTLAKRRDDVVRMNETGEAPRKNTIRYNLTFINQAITITASVTLVCYIMYTMSPEAIASSHSNYLYLTSVYVVVGLMRYIQLAVVDKKSGDPTKVMLYDHVMQVILLAWCITYLLLIYFC